MLVLLVPLRFRRFCPAAAFLLLTVVVSASTPGTQNGAAGAEAFGRHGSLLTATLTSLQGRESILVPVTTAPPEFI